MKKPHWIFFCLSAVLAAGWLGDAVAGHAVARLVAAHFGNLLLRIGQGKFVPIPRGSCVTGWWNFSGWPRWPWDWLSFIGGLIRGCSGGIRMSIGARIANGLLGFMTLNIWVGVAMNTILFWAVLGVGGGVQNLMQFEFKRILLEENRTPVRAVLMGNSQTRAETQGRDPECSTGHQFLGDGTAFSRQPRL